MYAKDLDRFSRRSALGAAFAGFAVGSLGASDVQGASPPATPEPWAAPDAGVGDWDGVEALARHAESSGGVVGVAVRGKQGELFSYRGDRRFHAASTIKVPIMVTAYQQIERGTLSLDDQYLLRDEDRVPGSGVLGNLHAGLDLTLADLLYLMIAVSDNTATNLVIDRVGLDAVNESMTSLGMGNSVLARRMLGRLPAEGDPENWATPSDFAHCLQAIVANEAAGTDSCAQMLQTLEKQEEIRRISRFIPDEADARWGTKPGDLPGVVNDVGFVTTERGTLCLAVFCENLANLDAAERAIGVIAREALSVAGVVTFEETAAAETQKTDGNPVSTSVSEGDLAGSFYDTDIESGVVGAATLL